MQYPLFDETKCVSREAVVNPDTYKGLQAFHKYWGKKHTESISYLIQSYTDKGEIILDPFLGSGFVSLEAKGLGRRFIGMDINPFSIEYTNFLLSLPSKKEYTTAIESIKGNIYTAIAESYRTDNGNIASHYLWKGDDIVQVWHKNKDNNKRVECIPKQIDRSMFLRYCNYRVRNMQSGIFFNNSRINSFSDMTIYDLFTRRALRNMDLLIDEINKYSSNHRLREALLMTLTSASGQMSNMVFAITKRGKTKAKISDRIEVGSWAIGLWRPTTHFEINVWNCFESRAKKLLKILANVDSNNVSCVSDIETFFRASSDIAIVLCDSRKMMCSIPSGSVKMIITDPPHGDRIPYLELSEMWNCIIGKSPNYEDEIVISDAKERNKTVDVYLKSMIEVMQESDRVLVCNGFLSLYFNSRDMQCWKVIEQTQQNTNLEFLGAFPINYSATSIVQDNRKGAMKSDYALIFSHKDAMVDMARFEAVDGWKNAKQFKVSVIQGE